MSLAKEMRHILPRLRRFGQMLLGSQSETDRIIKICLQRLVDSSVVIDSTQDTAVVVFETFIGMINTGPNGQGLPQTKNGASTLADEFLSKLLFVERQVFLLCYIEEFSTEETAQIMGITEQDITDLVRRVEGKLSRSV